jgi:hypothetical protein
MYGVLASCAVAVPADTADAIATKTPTTTETKARRIQLFKLPLLPI